MTGADLDKLLDQYDFTAAAEQIAQRPASPRDSSRLLCYDRASQEIAHAHFRDLPKLLPPNAVLVLNETRVIPARLKLTKTDTGGEVRALVIGEPRKGLIEALVDRKVNPGQLLKADTRHLFEAISLSSGKCLMRPQFPITDLPQLLAKQGHAPLPPYIKRHGLTRSALLKKYQTVFAKQSGSVAAPTASLHFTPRLLKRLEANGFKIIKVTLHVSLGTFAPLTEQHLTTGKLHEERWEISSRSAEAINRARAAGRAIIPVGTTALRALESATGANGRVKPGSGVTRLFIRKGYRFRVADGLVTNFHVPRSSLLMLVSALIGRTRLLALYRLAIRQGYRLFSFGDAMLIK